MFKQNFTDSQLIDYLRSERVLSKCKKIKCLPVNEYWKGKQLIAVVVHDGKSTPPCVYTYNQK